jgi:L-fuconolactonase
MEEPLRVDTHPHIISPDTDRYPIDPLGGTRSNWSADAHSNTPEELIAAMDEAGVAKAAVVHSSTTYGYDNSLVLDAVAAYPDRLTAVCSFDALADDAVDVLKGLISRGCAGIRFFTTGTTMPGQATWLNSPETYPVWQFASKINLPICVQANPAGMDMLSDMMDRFPDVPIILDHCGRADLQDGPPYADSQIIFAMGARYPQLTVKFSPAVIERASKGKAMLKTFVPLIVNAFGTDRIIWGSNFPASHGTLREIAEACETAFSFLPKPDVDKIMGTNALRLYPSLNC